MSELHGNNRFQKRGKSYVANFKISKNNIHFLDIKYLNTFVKMTKQKEETFMLQDIKILKNNTDFLEITSLNTFIKNTIITQS